MRFPADVAYVASVRDFAAATVDDLGGCVRHDDLALIVGELAANAAVHQAGDAEILIRVRSDGGVDVEVVDGDPTIPEAVTSDPTDIDGHRGLRLVSTISHSWGVTPEGPGKRIWARLSPTR